MWYTSPLKKSVALPSGSSLKRNQKYVRLPVPYQSPRTKFGLPLSGWAGHVSSSLPTLSNQ